MNALARWESTWSALGLTPPAGARDELLAHLAESHRAYHNWQHLEECFARLDEARARVAAPAELECAIWYHDAIYEPLRHDNEERSAELAEVVLRAAGADPAVRARIGRHILATKRHEPGAEGDTAWMIDLDLAILGADEPRFAEYERQVRREYRWVPGFLFRRKRHEFLRAMLARPTIFGTDFFRSRLEEAARRNLRQVLGEAVPRPGAGGR